MGSAADQADGDVGGIFVIGLLVVAWGGWQLISARRFRARAVRVPGMITHLSPGESLYHPVFRFTTLEGREVEVKSRFGENKWKTGDRIAVLYHPKKPKRARIDTAGQHGSAMGWATLLFGAVFAVAGALGLLGVA